MSIPSLSRFAVALCGAGLLAAAGPAAAVVAVPASPFSSLFVIGDSLSDNGNLFAVIGQPSFPYYQGRFSNGPVAADVLAAGLGLAGTPGYVNLAVGGARTGTGGEAPDTGMLVQTQALLTRMPALPSTGLYMVWGGANDLRNGVSGATAIGNLASIVTQLHTAGARNFLLPNLPDLGLTPEAREQGEVFAGFASGASVSFNQALAGAYAGLAQQWTDETFYLFDAMGAQHVITSGSPGNGFTNVSNRCFDTRGAMPTLCATPDSYLYWDNIHPTASAHQILGNQMLAAVPEPGAMLLMATGALALLGLQRRRQRPQA
jgi:phospholipase/lecithinase/hemolysin